MVDKEKAAEELRKIANDWANCVWDEEEVPDEDKTPESTLCLAKAAGSLGYCAGHDQGEAKGRAEERKWWALHYQTLSNHIGCSLFTFVLWEKLDEIKAIMKELDARAKEVLGDE